MSVSRSQIAVWSVVGAVIVALAGTLAWVGTHFDNTRIELEDLQGEVDLLQDDYDGAVQERDELKQKAQQQEKSIEQLHAEIERLRKAPAAPASSDTPAP